MLGCGGGGGSVLFLIMSHAVVSAQVHVVQDRDGQRQGQTDTIVVFVIIIIFFFILSVAVVVAGYYYCCCHLTIE